MRRFRHIKAVHLRLSPAEIRALALNPLVTYISPNRAVSGSLDVTTQTVGANAAWQSGWTGAGVGVAVIDSGIFAHDDLMSSSGQSRIVYSQSFVTGLTGTDLYGHGTHVAGIIGSNGTGFHRRGLHPHLHRRSAQRQPDQPASVGSERRGDGQQRNCGHRPGHQPEEHL